ncbi:response regulator [Methanoplanus limicola]|uniref:histidine kinase n=1 Tax=Methanoplanus limicola DSM 2279 TaxID=937775 RepID=H1Z0J3_9EURY|nr:response regulator [Methanoplanus limicola]EHQ35250.1 signal transduction histidine kinase [Methanoplanus limicola DSM 2279]
MKKTRVVIVEDSEFIAHGLEKILQSMGYNVAGIASEKAAALKLVEESSPDVILMDIELSSGGMEGISIAEEIKKVRAIPVIFLSAHDDDATLRKSLQAEPYGFISKPAKSRDIRAAIEIVLNKNRARIAEEELLRKDAILHAVCQSANNFFSENIFDTNIRSAIKNLGIASGADRVSIFILPDGDKTPSSVKKAYSWHKEGYGEFNGGGVVSEYSAISIHQECFNGLRKGAVVTGNHPGCGLSGGSGSDSDGKFSFMAAPVFLDEQWWGIVRFDNCHDSRVWSLSEKEALTAAASMIGSAVRHEIIEKNLRNEEDRYKYLYNLVRVMCDNVPDMIWSKDRNNCYTFANRELCRKYLFASDTSEPVGKPITYFIERTKAERPDDHEWFTLGDMSVKTDLEVMETGKPVKYEDRGYLRGRYVYLDVFKSPFFDSSGNIIGTLGCTRDITEEKRTRDEIKRSLDEKTILLQEVHHRVKNNLAIVNSLLSMQGRSVESSDIRNSLKDAEMRIFSISSVHEELYKSEDFSHIDADRHFTLLGEEIIGNYAAGTLILLDVDCKGIRLGLNTAIPVSLVVNELLTNSLKYAFSGRDEGVITIKAGKEDMPEKEAGGNCDSGMDNMYGAAERSGGCRICIEVSDDGIGMKNTVDPENTSSLGLSLVKNIVRMQLDGELTFESPDEGGTICRFCFSPENS